MHPPGMETGIDPSSFPHSSILEDPGHGEWGGRWGRGGVTAKNPSGILPQPPAALLQRHRVLHTNALFPHSQRREPKGEPRRHKKNPLGQARSLHSLREGLSALTPKHCCTYCRMNWMASSYFIPLSIKASATRTGALKGKSSGCHSPVTQPRG